MHSIFNAIGDKYIEGWSTDFSKHDNLHNFAYLEHWIVWLTIIIVILAVLCLGLLIYAKLTHDDKKIIYRRLEELEQKTKDK